MRDLLHFEYRRLFRRASLYVCLGVIAAPLMMMMLILWLSKLEDTTISYYSCVSTAVRFANLSIMSVIFTSIFVCEDHSRGTEKTIYSLGFSRTKLFFSKFLASATGTALLYSVVMLFGFSAALFFGSPEKKDEAIYFSIDSLMAETELNIFLYAVQQFFVIMALHAFYYMFAELVKKTGVSIVLGVFIPGSVLMLAFIIFSILGNIFQDNEAVSKALMNIFFTFSKYWLPSNTASMVSLFSVLIGDQSADITISIIVNIGYIAVFGGLALLITSKKEIKG